MLRISAPFKTYEKGSATIKLVCAHVCRQLQTGSPPVKMASANQEPSGHNLAFQRQQQELIKLLAQHFHHQFYQQLAANNTTTIENTSNNEANLSLQPPAVLGPYSMHAGHRYPPEATLLGPGGFDLRNGINLAIASNDGIINSSNRMLHNHLLRSQQPAATTEAATANAGTTNSIAEVCAGTSPESLLDFTANNNQNHTALNSTYPVNLQDMNLLNALGLTGLTNPNQLVLSLQQQSLIQAATTAAATRQYELRSEFEQHQQFQHQHHHHLHQQQQQQHLSQLQHRTAATRQSSSKETSLAEDNTIATDSKSEMLKFSINTILGGGSPKAGVGELIKPTSMLVNQVINHHEVHETRSTLNARSGDRQISAKRGDKLQHKQGLSRPIEVEECDAYLESGSESSGPIHDDDDNDDSSTPTPQSSGLNPSAPLYGSNPLNYPLNAPDHLHQQQQQQQQHRSANCLTGSRGNSGNPLSSNRHTNQEHLNQAIVANHQSQQQHSSSLAYLAGSPAFPWTVAARGKPRRGMMRRAVFSDSQRVGLEKRFQLQKYISKPDRKKLAEKLGLRDSQVKIWFQNRRMKWRNSKERELLSAGGSREQTLPTRNNPNPDLSDVGETIKRLTSSNNITDSSVLNNSLSK